MENRVLYAVMTLIFNSYGVPCFMQGKTKNGILAIVLGVVTCGIVGIINVIKGIIMAIKIFKMTDEEYAATDKVTLLDVIPSVK